MWSTFPQIFIKFQLISEKKVKVAPSLFFHHCVWMALVVHSDHFHKTNVVAPLTGAVLLVPHRLVLL